MTARRSTVKTEFEIVMSPKETGAFCSSLLRWYRKHGRDLPWRRTRDPYAVLVSELMLQQTQVATVIPYYEKWLRQFPDFAALARASQQDVLHAWQGLGYYARALNLRDAARIIMQRHGGDFPHAIDQMQQLPGIGKYTACAVASFAFNQATSIVESNTARVLARLCNLREPIDSQPGRARLWQEAARRLPRSNAAHYNAALIDLGALVCIPRKPRCGICPVRRFCRAKNPALLPIKKSPLRTKRVVERHAFVVRHGRILLEQSSRRWRGMWILPPLARERFRLSPAAKRAVYRNDFPFTHHRITLAAYSCSVRKRIAPSQRWFSSIDGVPMPSPHRRAAQALLRKGAPPPGAARRQFPGDLGR